MNNYRVSYVRGTAPNNDMFPSFQGWDGNDLVFAMGSYRSILTAGGDDVVISFGIGNYADLGDGNDTGIAVGGNISFYGGNGNDILVGGAGSDGLVGGDGADILVGGAGNDFLSFDVNDSVVSGGDGNDFFFFNPTRVDITTPTNVPTALVMTRASGAVSIADFNTSEGDVLNMAALGASQENVYSDVETNSTTFVTPESVIVVVGVAFGDVGAAIANRSLILGYDDFGGRG